MSPGDVVIVRRGGEATVRYGVVRLPGDLPEASDWQIGSASAAVNWAAFFTAQSRGRILAAGECRGCDAVVLYAEATWIGPAADDGRHVVSVDPTADGHPYCPRCVALFGRHGII